MNLPIRIISVLTGTMRRQSQGWFLHWMGGTLMLMSNEVENEDINKRILDLTSNNELLDIAREHITFVPIDESIDRDFASVFISGK